MMIRKTHKTAEFNIFSPVFCKKKKSNNLNAFFTQMSMRGFVSTGRRERETFPAACGKTPCVRNHYYLPLISPAMREGKF